jgi:hypothetical protein
MILFYLKNVVIPFVKIVLKIYKIIDNTNDNIYIGSTCEYILSRRLAGHRSMYDRYVKGAKNYTTSFEILKNENYCIILLESYPCDTKDQLTSRESFFTSIFFFSVLQVDIVNTPLLFISWLLLFN